MGFRTLCGAAGLLALVGTSWACGGGAADTSGTSGELTELVERAGEVTGPDRPSAPEGASPGGDAAGAADPETAQATRGEVSSICGVYRRALTGRWDDQRTREEIRGLELASATAHGWREALAGEDTAAALDASREVVTAGESLQVGSDCDALGSLVAIADAMKDAPGSLQR